MQFTILDTRGFADGSFVSLRSGSHQWHGRAVHSSSLKLPTNPWPLRVQALGSRGKNTPGARLSPGPEGLCKVALEGSDGSPMSVTFRVSEGCLKAPGTVQQEDEKVAVDATREAKMKAYLEHFQIHQFLTAVFEHLLNEKPADPLGFLGDCLRKASDVFEQPDTFQEPGEEQRLTGSALLAKVLQASKATQPPPAAGALETVQEGPEEATPGPTPVSCGQPASQMRAEGQEPGEPMIAACGASQVLQQSMVHSTEAADAEPSPEETKDTSALSAELTQEAQPEESFPGATATQEIPIASESAAPMPAQGNSDKPASSKGEDGKVGQGKAENMYATSMPVSFSPLLQEPLQPSSSGPRPEANAASRVDMEVAQSTQHVDSGVDSGNSDAKQGSGDMLSWPSFQAGMQDGNRHDDTSLQAPANAAETSGVTQSGLPPLKEPFQQPYQPPSSVAHGMSFASLNAPGLASQNHSSWPLRLSESSTPNPPKHSVSPGKHNTYNSMSDIWPQSWSELMPGHGLQQQPQADSRGGGGGGGGGGGAFHAEVMPQGWQSGVFKPTNTHGSDGQVLMYQNSAEPPEGVGPPSEMPASSAADRYWVQSTTTNKPEAPSPRKPDSSQQVYAASGYHQHEAETPRLSNFMPIVQTAAYQRPKLSEAPQVVATDSRGQLGGKGAITGPEDGTPRLSQFMPSEPSSTKPAVAPFSAAAVVPTGDSYSRNAATPVLGVGPESHSTPRCSQFMPPAQQPSMGKLAHVMVGDEAMLAPEESWADRDLPHLMPEAKSSSGKPLPAMPLAAAPPVMDTPRLTQFVPDSSRHIEQLYKVAISWNSAEEGGTPRLTCFMPG